MIYHKGRDPEAVFELRLAVMPDCFSWSLETLLRIHDPGDMYIVHAITPIRAHFDRCPLCIQFYRHGAVTTY
jgi:hypothetical protein